MKKILLLGATGSIGTQTLDLIKEYPDALTLIGITANHSIDTVKKIVEDFNCDTVMLNASHKDALIRDYPNIDFYDTTQFDTLITSLDDDVVIVNALVGSVGLRPTLLALKHNHDVLLANKETLVVGGELIKTTLKTSQGRLIPIDSEHSGISQCLKGNRIEDVEKIVITASGGSFRHLSKDALEHVTVQDALKHPNWSMGHKITVDSATMMNKVFEVIEAHYLFDLPYDKIDTLLHEESIVHGMVHFKDGNVVMHTGPADMHIPLISALGFPERMTYRTIFDITKFSPLHFKPMDYERYSLFDLGIAVARKKGLHTVVLNAANEAAVELFLLEKITFLDIEKIIVDCLHTFDNKGKIDLDTIITLDQNVKNYVKKTYLDGE
ncbi:MAG: 1-deoxy-D-xylulose-5-phosphate reductoisomerase [Bacillota bacterium]